MKPKIVYVRPGEMLEIRIVHEAFEKTAAEWRQQSGTRPPKLLLMVNATDSISAADPAVSLDPWPTSR